MLSALQDLDRLYGEIEGEVFGDSASQALETAALTDPIIRNRQLIVRLGQMGARLSKNTAQWLQRRDRVSREEREQVRKLADPIRLRASRLLRCCEDRARQLETCLAGLQGELCQVRNGVRFLQSSRPARINYPKFIDSHG
jgi:hypothetical protein